MANGRGMDAVCGQVPDGEVCGWTAGPDGPDGTGCDRVHPAICAAARLLVHAKTRRLPALVPPVSALQGAERRRPCPGGAESSAVVALDSSEASAGRAGATRARRLRAANRAGPPQLCDPALARPVGPAGR